MPPSTSAIAPSKSPRMTPRTPARGRCACASPMSGSAVQTCISCTATWMRASQRPLTFGHEMSGVIESVGADVTEWTVGDAVTVMPLDWDGTCPACLAGNQHICQNLNFIGIDSPGALQTLWNVPASTLVRLPEDLALDVAALVEPVAVAVHDVRRSELVRGDQAVVIGGGPIGMLIAICGT